MRFNYLKNNIKFFTTASLLNILYVSLMPAIAEVQPAHKSLDNLPKTTSIKTSEKQDLALDLLSSRSFAHQTHKTNFEQQNDFELSQIRQIIPLRNQPLIANAFGGQASWYGPGFHGRRTANGEIYNQNAMTAAHRYLKFGTKVRVTNLNNGRSVIVRINDRGPFAKGRVIDVSAAAARSLGMIRSGVAPVEVTILGR